MYCILLNKKVRSDLELGKIKIPKFIFNGEILKKKRYLGGYTKEA